MIKVFTGNEPYMAEFYIKAYMSKLSEPELNYRKFDGLTGEVADFLSTLPFFDEGKVAVIRVQNLKEVDNATFKELSGFISEGNMLLIHADQCDKRTSFYKELVEKKVVENFDKEDALLKLPSFLAKSAAEVSATFADGVVDLMIRRIGYIENPEVTISTLVGYVKSIAAISKEITKEVMESVVPCYEKEERFALAKMVLNKDIIGLKTQASLLRGEEISCLSALLREYRIAYKSKYFSLKDIGVGFCTLAKKDKKELARGINILTHAISSCKNGTAPESLLMDCFMRLI